MHKMHFTNLSSLTPSLFEILLIIYLLHVLCVLFRYIINSNEGNYTRFNERLNHKTKKNKFLRLRLGYGT